MSVKVVFGFKPTVIKQMIENLVLRPFLQKHIQEVSLAVAYLEAGEEKKKNHKNAQPVLIRTQVVHLV